MSDGAVLLKEALASDLDAARRRSLDLLEPVTDDDLLRQHSPLMSPLVWDLAHVGHYEELWLLRAVARRAYPHLAATRGLWLEAARHGLDHPVLAEAAGMCLRLVAEALDGSPEKDLAGLVRAYAGRYTDRGRCPADDLLADWRLAVS